MLGGHGEVEAAGNLGAEAAVSEPTGLEDLLRVIEEKVEKDETQNFDGKSEKKESSR